MSFKFIIVTLICCFLMSCVEKTTESENNEVIVATPLFNIHGGDYSSTQLVTISCTTTGAVIRYTTDGSTPINTSLIFDSPIIVNRSMTLKAKAFLSGYNSSAVVTEVFSINIPPMAFVQGGSFQMGSDYEGDQAEPIHSVVVSSFYIGKYEVTQQEWQMIMGYNPSAGYGIASNYPVYNVDWYEAVVYCNKRSLQEGYTPCYSIYGQTDPENWGALPASENTSWDSVFCDWSANGYRLPTEAEWEFAARGGNLSQGFIYAGSNLIADVAWYSRNSENTSHVVGTKYPNELGLYDMSGSVSELCWDWHENYNSDLQNNPTGPINGFSRIIRGGSGSVFGQEDNCRVACRSYCSPIGYSFYAGFRILRRD